MSQKMRLRPSRQLTERTQWVSGKPQGYGKPVRPGAHELRKTEASKAGKPVPSRATPIRIPEPILPPMREAHRTQNTFLP